VPAAAPRDDEATSLAALDALQVLDTAPEVEFDALVRVATLVCGVPISLISLIDADRQWFKANIGLVGVSQTPRDLAFCAHAVLGDALLEVADTSLDPRFAANALVTGAPHIRFYAGAPLTLSDGSRVGTLCVIDRQPRRLDGQQREVLQQLAVAAARALEGRSAAATARLAVLSLAASEDRFRTLSDSAPLGIFATDAQGSCTYTNPRWQAIFGLPAQAALGRGWTGAVHPLDRDAVFSAWQQAVEGRQEFNQEFRILRPDQALRDVHTRARAITAPAGEVRGFVGSVEDVTERRRLEAFLDRTGRVAGVGGWELDLRTGTTSWSRQTRELHEVDADFQPDLGRALQFYAPQAQPVITAAVQAGIDQGIAFDLELPLLTARGRALWVRVLGEVEREREGGLPIRLIGAIQDITEQRGRRIELQQEQALRAQIEQQMHETARLLRERSEMLDVMAHEVRQPLNNASAALQSAVRALDGLGEQNAELRLLRAQTVLAQVLASIDNTLAVAALLARPDPIERADADIDALLRVVVADVPVSERSRIRVQRDTRTRTAAMDTSLMRLALRNLLANALKHSPPEALVDIRLSDSDEPLALVIDVVDHGPGIAAGLLPRLFERGIHRGQPRAQMGQGLGLGLYIVRRVMELHGGSVGLLANGAQGVTMRLLVNQPLGD
jgi:PAS domain S-box-containing protein